MARLARVVIPPSHHVTRRGDGGARAFFSNADDGLYRDLLGEHYRAAAGEMWAQGLRPNHVHLVRVPSDEDGLRRALAGVHRRSPGIIQARRRRTGHFWQGRFGAVVMDDGAPAGGARLGVAQGGAGLPGRARATGAG